MADLKSPDIKGIKPEQIALIPIHVFAQLSEDQLAALDVVQIRQLTPSQLAAIPANRLEKLQPAAIKALSTAQMKALSAEQIENLDDETEKAAKFRLGVLAIKPGIRLIGDAYSQLVKKAEDGLNAENSFGGGIEIESLAGNPTKNTIVIRKGNKPATLATPEQFGDALLSPQSQAIFFGVELEKTWSRFVPNNLFGVHGHLYSARTDWQVELAKARDADPMNPAIDARPQQLENTAVYTFDAGLMAVWRYVAASGENYVDVQGTVGPTVRWLSVDDGVTGRIEEKRALDDRISDQSFSERALGTRKQFFPGLDLGASIRINSIVLSATVSVVNGDVPGLSGWKLIPAISLRAGPQLIEFDGQ